MQFNTQRTNSPKNPVYFFTITIISNTLAVTTDLLEFSWPNPLDIKQNIIRENKSLFGVSISIEMSSCLLSGFKPGRVEIKSGKNLFMIPWLFQPSWL